MTTCLPYRFRLSLAVLCVLTLLLTSAAPAGAAVERLTLSETLSRTIYFEHNGEIYRIDLADYLEGKAGFASGEGAFDLTLERIRFFDTPPSAGFLLRETYRSDFTILGSEAEYVDYITGVDPRLALDDERVLRIGFSRSRGTLEVAFEGELDALALQVPEAFLTDEKADADGRVVVNGRIVKLTEAEFNQLRRAGEGFDAGDVSEIPAVVAIEQAFHDAPRLHRAIVAFEIVLAELGGDGAAPTGSPCASPCLRCVTASLGYGGGWFVMISNACVGLVGCAGWLMSHAALSGAAAISCAACFGCLGQGGGSGPTCPTPCGLGTPCPPGCPCPDGSTAEDGCCPGATPGPGGCGCEPGCYPTVSGCECETCDPLTDPDGCACEYSYCL